MGGWLYTYNKFYSKLGNNAFLLTVRNTVNSFANSNKKLFNITTGIGTNSGKVIAKEIDAGYPPILLMNGHYRYGNHYVLALGYYQFSYSNYDSTYILIADGWTAAPKRYVWGGCSGSWYYVSVRPV